MNMLKQIAIGTALAAAVGLTYAADDSKAKSSGGPAYSGSSAGMTDAEKDRAKGAANSKSGSANTKGDTSGEPKSGSKPAGGQDRQENPAR